MTGADLEKILSVRPFRPVEISLENGDRHKVSHPEWIRMTPNWVMIEFPDEGLVIFEAADITSVRTLSKNARRK